MKNKLETLLSKIASKHGGLLRPSDVVEEASNPRHPLHSRFTWEDDEAARQYRLWQARQLISSVKVTYEVQERKIKVRAFVSLTPERNDEEAGGYRRTIMVVKNKLQRDQMLSDALAELTVFKEKYESLTELAEVCKAIRNLGI